jgi:hypothetical protein
MAAARRRQHRTRREYHKRREERVNVALPVRVVVLEQQRREFACTLDVTSSTKQTKVRYLLAPTA